MMRNPAPLLVAALTLALPPVAAAEGPPPTALIAPGAYHGEEVNVAGLGGWLALHPGGERGRARLEMATLAVETVVDPVVDAAGEATGRLVSVAGAGPSAPEPLLLLAADLGLRPGAVPEARPAAAELLVDVPIRLSIWGTGYDLALLRYDDRGLLYLRLGGEVQQLAAFPLHDEMPDGIVMIGNDAHPALLWAGDLDGDQRLDLYLDLSSHYNLSEKVLLLSTAAAPGELVGRAAEHVAGGC